MSNVHVDITINKDTDVRRGNVRETFTTAHIGGASFYCYDAAKMNEVIAALTRARDERAKLEAMQSRVGPAPVEPDRVGS